MSQSILGVIPGALEPRVPQNSPGPLNTERSWSVGRPTFLQLYCLLAVRLSNFLVYTAGLEDSLGCVGSGMLLKVAAAKENGGNRKREREAGGRSAQGK